MKYATIPRYAELCGLSKQAVYDRIEKGTLDTKTIADQVSGKDVQVIDIKKFPPERRKFSGKKFKEKQ